MDRALSHGRRRRGLDLDSSGDSAFWMALGSTRVPVPGEWDYEDTFDFVPDDWKQPGTVARSLDPGSPEVWYLQRWRVHCSGCEATRSARSEDDARILTDERDWLGRGRWCMCPRWVWARHPVLVYPPGTSIEVA